MKYMEVLRSVGVGALQHSTTTRGSRPEIYRMAPERSRKEREEVNLSCFLYKRVKPRTLEVEQFRENNTTKMNKVENTPLEKRNKEHCENLVG